MTSHFPKRSGKLLPSALLAPPCPMAADSLSVSAPSPLPGVSGPGQLGAPRPDAHRILLWAKAHAGWNLLRPRLKVLNIIFPALNAFMNVRRKCGWILCCSWSLRLRFSVCFMHEHIEGAYVAVKVSLLCIKLLNTSCKVRPEQRAGKRRQGSLPIHPSFCHVRPRAPTAILPSPPSSNGTSGMRQKTTWAWRP